jgi:hypothetical protein
MGEGPKLPKTWKIMLTHRYGDAPAVAACDKLHNATAILIDLKAIGPARCERFKFRRVGALWHDCQRSDALGARPAGPLTARLAHAVNQINAFS